MLKSSRDEIKKLELSKKELRVIARERGVKNYENISKSRLIKEIKKLKPSKRSQKIVFGKYTKKDDNFELKRKDIRKSFRSKKDILRKEKRSVEFKPKKQSKKYLKLKKLLIVYY